MEKSYAKFTKSVSPERKKVSDETELKLNETDFFGIYFHIQSSQILKSNYKLNKNNIAFVAFSKEICGAP